MKPLVSDELWAVVAPLLPPEPPKPKGGRPRVPDRAALTGVIFVLKSGIPWEMLPQELGCGSGVTCWRRLRDWQAAGAWDRLHRELLDRLGAAGQIDWSRASVDSASIPAKGGGDGVGPNPTDRGKPGTKRHVMGDRGGLPLASLLTGANRHDSVVFEELLDAVPPIRQPNGRRRKRPGKLHADKAYDIPRCRQARTRRHIKVRIARKGVDSSQRLGRHRWVIERTLAWLNRYRRLTVRYERRADIHQAFLTLGCCLICFNALQPGI
ncbi:MAG: IS5 family transposase [Chloroflexota bacterium]|nr:IS5 family transposase [Chloroflexota bacterium]MDP9472004.1 IS5 family transposase [Chloroflexota bacterium]